MDALHSRMHRWRLIESPAASGPENMALDEALLESVIAGEGPPTLRFYAWTPATLSIGFNQGDVLSTGRRVAEAPVPVVRRITGGRAILHDDELTYSVVCREDDPLFGGSVWETYLKLSRFLVAGLREIGVDARVAGEGAPAPDAYGRPSEGSPSCFSTPTPHEIAVGEAKIAAGAQRRVRGALLQHGSVLLGFDPERLARALGLDPEGEGDPERLTARVGWVRRYAGPGWDAPRLRAVLSEAFARTYGADLRPGAPTPRETALAEALKRRKYGDEGWTARREARASGGSDSV